MKSFTTHTGLAAFLDRSDVDTDQIIPKQFLKRVERTGFGKFLFFDWRYEDDGVTPRADFALNRPEAQGATILVTRRNFGCGSSREHAPWALADYGFRAILAPSFADIFRNNAMKNGLLPVVLTEDEIAALFALGPGTRLTVDLPPQEVRQEDGDFFATFEIDPFQKECLLNGWDEVALSLRHEDAVAEFEKRHETFLATTSPPPA